MVREFSIEDQQSNYGGNKGNPHAEREEHLGKAAGNCHAGPAWSLRHDAVVSQVAVRVPNGNLVDPSSLVQTSLSLCADKSASVIRASQPAQSASSFLHPTEICPEHELQTRILNCPDLAPVFRRYRPFSEEAT